MKKNSILVPLHLEAPEFQIYNIYNNTFSEIRIVKDNMGSVMS